jgi:hypothetical protein
MRKVIVVALLAALTASAAALAGGDPATNNAKTACVALKAKMGDYAFAQAYGSMGGCVSVMARVEAQNLASAQAACTAEQADANFAASHDGQTFAQFYGSGKSGKNGYENCLRTKFGAASHAEQANRVNPAETCRSIRVKLTAQLFNQTYGANANDKNAYGKCVSKTAQAQSTNEQNAAVKCKTDASGQHGGRAYGQCVASTAKLSDDTQATATVNAARACKAELNLGIAAFKLKYTSFGQCVALKVSSP